ncbi:hypothetical protein ABH920_008961 [Catenulispora sp. EB89]
MRLTATVAKPTGRSAVPDPGYITTGTARSSSWKDFAREATNAKIA